jgi:hypothetical protein
MLNRNHLRLFALKAVLALIVIYSMIPASPASAQSYLYQETATLTVVLVSVYGQSLGAQTYITNVNVYVDSTDPRGTNPFELIVQSVPLVNAPGEVSVWSSLSAEGVLFQYWTYQFDPASGTFMGSLTSEYSTGWKPVASYSHWKWAVPAKASLKPPA